MTLGESMLDDTLDLNLVRAIIALADETGVAELTVESPTVKISVRRAVAVPAAAAQVQAAPAPTASSQAPAAAPSIPAAGMNHLQPITAPMVGTFYRAPSPDAPAFVEEGEVVEAGQTVCIIEAMKLFNEIQSDLRGRLVKVLVENGVPVEYGQPLFLIDPSADGS